MSNFTSFDIQQISTQLNYGDNNLTTVDSILTVDPDAPFTGKGLFLDTVETNPNNENLLSFLELLAQKLNALDSAGLTYKLNVISITSIYYEELPDRKVVFTIITQLESFN